MHVTNTILMSITLATLTSSVAAATASADAATAARACVSVEKDTDRLACYDRALGRARASSAGDQPVSAVVSSAVDPPVNAVAKPVEPVADFGLTQQAKHERAGVTPIESVAARVTQVSRNAANRQVVTLDNGQVWTQTEAYVRVRVKTGDAVEIKKAALGSFVLSAPPDGSMRVKRLQ